jgi:MFS family permease
VLRAPGYRRLLAVRFATQWGDGLFQAALGGALLFNPERQADPLAVAAGLAVLLLPYSVIGPFAGALLDRWDRRRVLWRASVLRAALVLVTAAAVSAGVDGPWFYAAALATAGVNRFVLAGLSVALPHVVDRPRLVAANTLAVTAGAGLSAAGAATAIGVRALVGPDDAGSAVTTAVAALGALLAAAGAARFRRGALGPDRLAPVDVGGAGVSVAHAGRGVAAAGAAGAGAAGTGAPATGASVPVASGAGVAGTGVAGTGVAGTGVAGTGVDARAGDGRAPTAGPDGPAAVGTGTGAMDRRGAVTPPGGDLPTAGTSGTGSAAGSPGTAGRADACRSDENSVVALGTTGPVTAVRVGPGPPPASPGSATTNGAAPRGAAHSGATSGTTTDGTAPASATGEPPASGATTSGTQHPITAAGPPGAEGATTPPSAATTTVPPGATRGSTARAVLRGFVDGARTTAATPPVAAAFLALAAHRLAFGITTLLTLLLFRHSFTDDGLVRAGLAGIGEAVVAAAAGLGCAAAVTPWLVGRLGRARTVRIALLAAAGTQVGLALLLSAPAVFAAAFGIGLAGQVVKLCTDAAVQSDVPDGALGRVFALYDVLFNAGFVAAVTTAALLAPPDGDAPWLVGATAALYVGGLLAHDAQLRRTRVRTPGPPPRPAAPPPRPPAPGGRAPSAARAGAGTPAPPAAPDRRRAAP